MAEEKKESLREYARRLWGEESKELPPGTGISWTTGNSKKKEPEKEEPKK